MLDIFDNSSNEGFTRGLVVVVVEGVVEELELGVEAINGGSDTMKSIAMQEERNKGKTKKNERERFDGRKLCSYSLLNQIQAPIYIMVTRSVKSGINLTNSQSISPKL